MIGEANETVALRVVGWIVADSDRAARMFALTGLDPDSLRAGLNRQGTLRAMLDFVLGHEPDLIACAADLGLEPAAIAAARRGLGR